MAMALSPRRRRAAKWPDSVITSLNLRVSLRFEVKAEMVTSSKLMSKLSLNHRFIKLGMVL